MSTKYGIRFTKPARTMRAIFDTIEEATEYGNKVKSLYGTAFTIYEKTN